MKLEYQVVSLELAKRLKELGVKQESLFWWVNYSDGYSIVRLLEKNVERWVNKPDDTYSAFTVAELGMMLPELADSAKHGKSFRVMFPTGRGSEVRLSIKRTEADARADMMVYLLKNKLIDPLSKGVDNG